MFNVRENQCLIFNITTLDVNNIKIKKSVQKMTWVEGVRNGMRKLGLREHVAADRMKGTLIIHVDNHRR